jgi:RNA polymerase-binding protein DksA
MALQQHEMAGFRKHLQEERKALLDQIHHALTEAGHTTYADWVGEARDMEDNALADFLEDFEFAVIEHEIKTLKAIEEALARIDQNVYGQCIDCKADIEIERLQAFPAATRCYSCQEKFEKTHRHDPNPTL